MPENEMKPCPFCGGTEIQVNRQGEDWVSCRRCYATGPAHENVHDALSAWNARIPAQSAGGGEPTTWLVKWSTSETGGDNIDVYLAEEDARRAANNVRAYARAIKVEVIPLYARAVLTDTAREGVEQTRAASDVLSERARQISVEGWTSEHDDKHWDGGLAGAAAAYAVAGSYDDHARRLFLGEWYSGKFTQVRELWPRDWSWFKPKDRRRDLVKAGALILAEIERLDRIAAPSNVGTGEGA